MAVTINSTARSGGCHPRTREFQIVSEGTSNPYGLAWDAEGSAIVEACHWANDHLFHFVETGHYQRQAGRFPRSRFQLARSQTTAIKKPPTAASPFSKQTLIRRSSANALWWATFTVER
jgi:hypothetical protein